MKEIFKVRPTKYSGKGWVFEGDEVKYTSSRDIIQEELEKLHGERTFLDLVNPPFISSPTMLLSIRDDSLEFDLPSEWKDGLEQILVRYRFPAMPYHFLRVRVDSQGSSLFTSYPDIVAVLERRQFFRVEVPAESKVFIQKRTLSQDDSASHRGRPGWLGQVDDISIGGARLFFHVRTVPVPPPLRGMVGPVFFRLMLNGEKLFGDIKIPAAEVVRVRETSLHDRPEWEVGLRCQDPQDYIPIF